MAVEPRDEPTNLAGDSSASGETPMLDSPLASTEVQREEQHSQLDIRTTKDVVPQEVEVKPISELERVDLRNVKGVEPPEIKVKPMSELEREGIGLARRVLWLIAAITLALLILIAGSEFLSAQPESETIRNLVEHAAKQYISSGSTDALNNANTLIGRLSETRRASRDFWLSIGQFLLLNLLLPVLTSILGFIFGTMKSGDRD